jgi:hypothetical protein
LFIYLNSWKENNQLEVKEQDEIDLPLLIRKKSGDENQISLYLNACWMHGDGDWMKYLYDVWNYHLLIEKSLLRRRFEIFTRM